MSDLPKICEDRRTLAKEAFAAADLTGLKRLFDQAQQDIADLVKGFHVYASRDDKYPPHASDDVIAAMHDVALAAIQLARDVAVGQAAKTD
jgi:hypothetical protein